MKKIERYPRLKGRLLLSGIIGGAMLLVWVALSPSCYTDIVKSKNEY